GCAGAHERDGTPFEARAEHIIVASGGINGDIPRVKANWHRDWRKPPEVILNGSHKYADGKLHDAVATIGGRLSHLDNMWNYASGVHHYRPRKPLHGLSLVPAKAAPWLSWLVEEMMVNCRDFVVARSLPELVDKMNALQGDGSVDRDALTDAVRRYDAEVARAPELQADAQLRRIAELRQYRGDRMRISKS